MHCDYSANHECENEAGMKHFIKHGEILGCAGCCAVCLKKNACEYHCKYVISKENAAPMTRHSPEDKSLAVLYSNLPNNLCTTIRANTEEFAKHMNRSVQEYGQACVNVMNVNAALADRYSGRWAEWCESVGLSTRSATRMVEVGKNILGSAKLAELVQDGQIGKSLLQAICAPSAEPEAVDQVLSGDIKTHKEYLELLDQLKAEKERAEEADTLAEARLADVNALAESNSRLMKELDAAKKDVRGTEESYRVAKKNEQFQCDRIKKLSAENEALKNQPIAAVMDEEEMDRQIKEGSWKIAADMNAELKYKLRQMQENDLAWVFDSRGRIESEWEHMIPLLERMENAEKAVVLDKMLETLGRIQAQAFALYPDEKEKQDEVQCAH